MPIDQGPDFWRGRPPPRPRSRHPATSYRSTGRTNTATRTTSNTVNTHAYQHTNPRPSASPGHQRLDQPYRSCPTLSQNLHPLRLPSIQGMPGSAKKAMWTNHERYTTSDTSGEAELTPGGGGDARFGIKLRCSVEVKVSLQLRD
jgi:hypothetical protein